MGKKLTEVTRDAVLERFEQRINNSDVRPLLESIGVMMSGRVMDAFETGGRNGEWQPRSVPNVAGVVRDVNTGIFPKTRRFEDSQTGIDTGVLRASISYRIVGESAVEVGSTVPYASDFHEGGPRDRIDLNKTGIKKLAEFLEKYEEHQESLGWLLTAGGVKYWNIPARPFTFLTTEDEEDIGRLVGEFFLK